MSNGNDWSQGPEQPSDGGEQDQPGGQSQNSNVPMQQPQQPAGSPGGPGSGGGGGGNDLGALLTEGWGGGEFDTDVLTRNAKIAFKRALGPVVQAWIGIGLAVLVIELMASFFGIIGYFSDSTSIVGATSAIRGILTVLETPVYFVMAALQFSLYRPMRRELFEGPGAAGDLKSMVQSASNVALPVLGTQLLVYLIVGIAGMCLVAPGLFAAFILSMSVYMVATRGLGPFDGMKNSITMVKKYWKTVAVAFVGIILIGVAGGCVVTVFEFIVGFASQLIRPFDAVVIDLVTWLTSQAGIFGLFVVWSAVFGTIDSYESNDYIKE